MYIHYIACEGDVYHMNCPAGQRINVKSVSYGRSDTSTCQYQSCTTQNSACDQMQNTQCSSTSALNFVQALCNNKEKCSVLVNNTVLGGDPCVGTHKYATFLYDCFTPTVCEYFLIKPSRVLFYTRFKNSKPLRMF